MALPRMRGGNGPEPPLPPHGPPTTRPTSGAPSPPGGWDDPTPPQKPSLRSTRPQTSPRARPPVSHWGQADSAFTGFKPNLLGSLFGIDPCQNPSLGSSQPGPRLFRVNPTNDRSLGSTQPIYGQPRPLFRVNMTHDPYLRSTKPGCPPKSFPRVNPTWAVPL